MSDRSKGKTANQPPVSAHPAFPVIVALWFAALFGIGSMVLPMDMFERLSVSSGLADAFAAAQPPLGESSRWIVAFAAAVLGGLAGVLVARKVAATQAASTARRAAGSDDAAEETFVKRPISAHEELGEGGLDADADADAGTATQSSFDARRRVQEVLEESAAREFRPFAAPLAPEQDADEEQAHLVDFGEPNWVETDDPAEQAYTEDFNDDWEDDERQAFEPATEERAPVTGETETAPRAVLRERAVADLNMVELVERFALALQSHRETRVAEFAVDAPAEEFTAFTSEPASQFPEIPVALRPYEFADEFGEDEMFEDEAADEPEGDYPSLLAIKNSSASPRAPMRFEHADDIGDEPVVVFPGAGPRRSVRSLESEGAAPSSPTPEPAPTARPAEAGATERALREALEKLQRMSGAA